MHPCAKPSRQGSQVFCEPGIRGKPETPSVIGRIIVAVASEIADRHRPEERIGALPCGHPKPLVVGGPPYHIGVDDRGHDAARHVERDAVLARPVATAAAPVAFSDRVETLRPRRLPLVARKLERPAAVAAPIGEIGPDEPARILVGQRGRMLHGVRAREARCEEHVPDA